MRQRDHRARPALAVRLAHQGPDQAEPAAAAPQPADGDDQLRPQQRRAPSRARTRRDPARAASACGRRGRTRAGRGSSASPRCSRRAVELVARPAAASAAASGRRDPARAAAPRPRRSRAPGRRAARAARCSGAPTGHDSIWKPASRQARQRALSRWSERIERYELLRTVTPRRACRSGAGSRRDRSQLDFAHAVVRELCNGAEVGRDGVDVVDVDVDQPVRVGVAGVLGEEDQCVAVLDRDEERQVRLGVRAPGDREAESGVPLNTCFGVGDTQEGGNLCHWADRTATNQRPARSVSPPPSSAASASGSK